MKLTLKQLIYYSFIPVTFIVTVGHFGRDTFFGLALFFMMAIGAWGLYRGIKPFKNPFLLLLFPYIIYCVWQSPKPMLIEFNRNIGNFWFWKALVVTMTSLLAFLTVRSVEFTKEEVKSLLNLVCWVGVIVGVHALCHYLKLYQWTTLDVNSGPAMNTTNAKMAGITGHPTFTAPLVGMILPLALCLKRYWMAIFMAIVVVMTRSDVATGALVVTAIVWLFMKNKKLGVIALLLLSLVFGGLLYARLNMPDSKVGQVFNDSGRFIHWAQAMKDLKKPFIEGSDKSYPFTGIGFGAFEYIYHSVHDNNHIHLHNEYLELTYNSGIIGIVLFTLGYFWFVCKIEMSRCRRYLMLSFIYISICAGAAFVWQLGHTLYYTIIFIGLLDNDITKEIIL